MLSNQRNVLMKMQRGFTVVEFFIALALGSILTLTLFEIFISHKTNFRTAESLARMQDNISNVNNVLTRAARMTGYTGCISLSTGNVNNIVATPPSQVSLTIDDALQGFESTATSPATWSPSLPTGLATAAEPGTDVLEVRKASEGSAPLNAVMTAADDDVVITNTYSFSANNIVVITDCQNTDIFKISSMPNSTTLRHNNVANTSDSLSKAYDTNAFVMRFEANYFYIKNSGRVNQAGNPIFSLYQRDFNGNETEIAEGVENLQLSYGVDSNTDESVDSFLTADAIEAADEWSKVKSIRIALLFNSIEDVLPSPQSYTFNGATITPTDRMLRKEYDVYITFRNRNL